MNTAFSSSLIPAALDEPTSGVLSVIEFGHQTDIDKSLASRKLGLAIHPLAGLKVETRDVGDTTLETLPGALIVRGKSLTLVRIVEPEAAASEHLPDGFYHTSKAAYDRLFKTISKNNLGTLVRIWNYIPRYLEDTSDSIPEVDRERYRQFNAGRLDSWMAYGPKNELGHPVRPAATGMGTVGGPLILEALLTPFAVTHISNPRQTDPFNYPSEFGTKAPAFARATLLHSPNGPELYISGTASIVGNDTVHIGDAAAQFEEILRNLEALLDAANKEIPETPLSIADLRGIRVYIKDESDFETIRELAQKALPGPCIFLKSDICRADLLVEVEAIAKAK